MDYNEKQRLMKIRKNQKKQNPKFRRVESWRKVKVKDNWRKPRGLDNKSRKHLKCGIKSPKAGYRSPKNVRYLHPSGLEDVLIMNKNDLKGLNPKKQGVRIGTRLGGRKKIELIEAALDKGFKVFNLGIDIEPGMEEFESYDEEELTNLDDLEELEDDQIEEETE